MGTVWRGKEARVDKCIVGFDAFMKKYKYTPSLHELAEAMGVAYATAHLAVKDCIEAGLMERLYPGQARAIYITEAGKKVLPRAKARKKRANGKQ